VREKLAIGTSYNALKEERRKERGERREEENKKEQEEGGEEGKGEKLGYLLPSIKPFSVRC
jgi:hypothetical protein